MSSPHRDRYKFVIVSALLTTFLLYSGGLYSFLPVTRSTASATIDQGKQVWQKYNCTACHQVYGLGGYLGPDLTNVYSIRGEAYTRAFLQNGTDIMPNFHLNDQEVDELLAFLKDMDASGKADPRTFQIRKDGSIANH